jgi:hypothetical protein
MTKRKCAAHVFILPPPSGPTCLGVCRVCGTERVHSNFDPVGHAWTKEGVTAKKPSLAK